MVGKRKGKLGIGKLGIGEMRGAGCPIEQDSTSIGVGETAQEFPDGEISDETWDFS
jgi:hypothetical protein